MMNTVAGWIALLAYLGFATRPLRSLLSRWSARLGDWSVGILLLPYLLATGFSPGLDDLLTMAFFLALPTFWLSLGCGRPSWRGLFNILTVVSIWLPIEPDLFLLLFNLAIPGKGLEAANWSERLSLPEVEAVLAGEVVLPIGMLTAILLTLYLFTVHRPLSNIGFSFRWHWANIKSVVMGLAGFSLVGIPLGMSTGFLHVGGEAVSMGEVVLMLLAGYLLVALPEEILFRGVIQNLLEKGWGRFWTAWPVASIIFGLAHLNNATPRFAVPNWGYVAMASLAGLAYGWVYRRSGKVTVSAITHALVNLIWGVIFTA